MPLNPPIPVQLMANHIFFCKFALSHVVTHRKRILEGDEVRILSHVCWCRVT